MNQIPSPKPTTVIPIDDHRLMEILGTSQSNVPPTPLAPDVDLTAYSRWADDGGNNLGD